jgi:hypothetical protein
MVIGIEMEMIRVCVRSVQLYLSYNISALSLVWIVCQHDLTLSIVPSS